MRVTSAHHQWLRSISLNLCLRIRIPNINVRHFGPHQSIYLKTSKHETTNSDYELVLWSLTLQYWGVLTVSKQIFLVGWYSEFPHLQLPIEFSTFIKGNMVIENVKEWDDYTVFYYYHQNTFSATISSVCLSFAL